MRGIDEVLRENSGVAHVDTLRQARVSRRQLAHALDRGSVFRVRPAIYAHATAPRDVVRAARVGGRLAGFSAALHHGLWVPSTGPLCVEVSRGASRLRHPDIAARPLSLGSPEVKVLWTREATPLARALGVTPLVDTLAQVASTAPAPFAVATIDSALRRSPISSFDLEELALTLPPAASVTVLAADGSADSGSESVLRYHLRAAGLDPVAQAHIPFTLLDRADFRIGDRLFLECDSEQHHGGLEARRRDLRRDTELACLGIIVLRFDYAQIIHDIDTVVAAVLSYVDRGLHLGAPSRTR